MKIPVGAVRPNSNAMPQPPGAVPFNISRHPPAPIQIIKISLARQVGEGRPMQPNQVPVRR
eukprot:2134571-Pyramimonas_sp.AAC.1